jgi:hypothetical protein
VRYLLILLLNIIHYTLLLRFSGIVLFLSRSLGFTVSSHGGDTFTDKSRNSVANTGGKIVYLALGFLCFAVDLLLLTFVLEAL